MKPAGSGDHPPVTGTYWVVAGKLLAGPFPGAPDPAKAAAKVSPLLAAGITTFVNLMEADETDGSGRPFTPYASALGDAATMTRHPIHDLSIPTRQGMTATLDTIDAARSGGVYVHCWGGVGRTGTVVGCWLLRHGMATPDNVIETIGLLRRIDPVRGHRPSPETPDQRRFVLEWQEQ